MWTMSITLMTIAGVFAADALSCLRQLSVYAAKKWHWCVQNSTVVHRLTASPNMTVFFRISGISEIPISNNAEVYN